MIDDMVNLELDTSEKVKLIQGEEFIVRKVKNTMSKYWTERQREI